MTSTDNTGLGLFDDTASAVGNFPSALRGYDRNAVDDYVRSLEGTLVNSRRRTSELEQELGSVSDQLEQAQAAANDVDYTNLGWPGLRHPATRRGAGPRDPRPGRRRGRAATRGGPPRGRSDPEVRDPGR